MPLIKAESTKDSHVDTLQQTRTQGSIQIPADLLEQLYLSPETRVKGRLRQTFGNPTPVALGGFLVCASAHSMTLLGWQGASGLGGANLGCFLYVGGAIQFLGAIGEWVLGNTFSTVVFFTFGGFWLTYATAINPNSGASAEYSPNPHNPALGLSEPGFFATFGFFLVAMTLVIFFFAIASVRTNLVFFTVFLTLIPTVACLSAAFFALAHGDAATAATCEHVGGGLLLAVAFLGWYIFLSLLLLSVDFPIRLPMGDLSTRIQGFNQRQKAHSNPEESV
ncbi:hypothetical protein N7532_000253 [Penicillium argentinense]|uniref:Uncharacterized protein n=1 Tax=Penicillium argentinense TaxID=1131581 RepID=A0A9W9G515_9EURO|nr:uncharacterized protein N7532_000253 [Penicillium argentinense]KAJ5112208.1 hypothetical protein N7532_000253 [Penicillium argentinense]